MYEITKEGNEYVCKLNGETMWCSEKISFLFDKEDGIVFKWGRPEFAEECLKEYTKRYLGLEWMLNNLMIITLENVDVETINKIINSSGYILKYIKTLNIKAPSSPSLEAF